MEDRLDQIISKIQETSSLSAEVRNMLHACMSRHPWGRVKSEQERKGDAMSAILGCKTVDGNLRGDLENV